MESVPGTLRGKTRDDEIMHSTNEDKQMTPLKYLLKCLGTY